jgi:hypothetical protein
MNDSRTPRSLAGDGLLVRAWRRLRKSARDRRAAEARSRFWAEAHAGRRDAEHRAASNRSDP